MLHHLLKMAIWQIYQNIKTVRRRALPDTLKLRQRIHQFMNVSVK